MGSEVGAGGSRCSGLAAARAVQVWSAAEENWCRVRLCAPRPGMLLCAAWQCRRGTWCASFGVWVFALPRFSFQSSVYVLYYMRET